MNAINPKLGVFAHGLVQFMVRHPATRAIYRLVPKSLRQRVLVELNEQATKATRFETLPAVAAGRIAVGARRAVSGIAASRDHEGVNVFGHLRGEFGLGESARMYAGALIEAGIPVALNDLDHDVPHAFADKTLGSDIRQGAPYATNLFFVSPDYMERAMTFIGPEALRGRTTIGCWFWELEAVPEQWRPAIESVDGIMVASKFTEDAFRRVTRKPIFRVSLPLLSLEDSGASRRDFGLPEEAFVFLVSFDFNSSIHRKNPFAAIDAFRSAFPAHRNDVRLMVKSSNGHRYPEELFRLLAISVEDPRVMVRDQVLPIAHVRALQKCADAYVSLHRAEGFGLGLAESMAMGKPVIATAWSGNMDFMTEDNSCLVDYRFVPVRDGEYPHGNGTHWADADVQQAAVWMRRLVDEPGLASGLGRKAALDVRVTLSSRAAACGVVSAVRAMGASSGTVRCHH